MLEVRGIDVAYGEVMALRGVGLSVGEGESVVTGEELCGTADARVTYGYKAETDHFLECILDDRDHRLPRTCFQDALRTMELVDRIESGGDRA